MADTDEGNRTERLPMHVLQLPSADWRFNVFLDDLASNISDEELARLKNYVSGDGGLGLGLLEKIKSPLELFKILKKRMIISKDNLITLQGMLWHLRNKELHTKAVEYAMKVDNTLYFYAPSDTPENGYKYVKIHVRGRDFRKIRRSDLEQLRTTVSQLVMIPPQFVFVRGLEPSSSFIITFMMPEYYVSVLVEIISKQNIQALTELGIDAIYINEKKFSLSGADESEVMQSEEEKNMANTFARLHLAEQQLQQSDIEYLKLSRELESSRQELNQAHQTRQNIGVLMGNGKTCQEMTGSKPKHTPEQSGGQKPETCKHCGKTFQLLAKHTSCKKEEIDADNRNRRNECRGQSAPSGVQNTRIQYYEKRKFPSVGNLYIQCKTDDEKENEIAGLTLQRKHMDRAQFIDQGIAFTSCQYCGKDFKRLQKHARYCKKNPYNRSGATSVDENEMQYNSFDLA